ncbi:hypothetical protein BDB01DRAFT_281523 [Pilobolus umbonatus]|nr:hypothetical protein BDB01DRAFT_281523 [Pilobolus umbonatus]
MPKEGSHKDFPQTSHAEAALGAGRAYESAREGHNEMFDKYEDLVKHNQQQPHHASKPSRGEQRDAELAEEDKETIERMNERKERKQEAKKTKHPHGEQ